MLWTALEKTSAYCVERKPLERWESVGLGGWKYVSDSVPIFFIGFLLIINEMKQTAALMLGILGLGAIFVQMNEVILRNAF